MNRRGFITSALALGAASQFPRFYRFSRKPAVPVLYGDGRHDDTAALNAWGAGGPVVHPDGTPVGKVLANSVFLVTGTIHITRQCKGLVIQNNFFKFRGEFLDRRPTFRGVA